MATSFIQSTPNTGFIPFTTTSPRSDVSSNSSYDDGPAENGRNDKFPSVEHRMYVINRNGSGEASYLLLTDDANAILSYRVHTETWKPIEGLLNFGVIVLDSWIYVIGGFDTGLATTLKRTIRYDPLEGQWVTCKDMCQPRSRFGACVVKGKIWVCGESGGERSDGKVTASCEVYDPEVNQWTKCGVLLAPRASPSCLGFGSDLLCAGGFHNGTAHNNLWLYEDHRWQELDEHYPHQLPHGLDRCAIASHGNTFYFIGGISTRPQPKLDSIKDKTQPKLSDTALTNMNNNDKLNTPMQKRHSKNPSKKLDGQQDQQPQRHRLVTERRVFSFTTSIQAGERKHTDSQLNLISPWNLKLPPLIHARHSAGAVTIGHRIHVMGGTSIETGNPVRMAEHFDLLTGRWDEDFTLRRCDVSNVSCVLVGVPKVPFQDRRSVVRLRWVMW